jgi:pyruvate dehydrogenase E2 component (dihydrolipoamide acetyltransferase)
MITEVIMPKLGLTMTEGTILNWLIEEGQTTQLGENLLSVETDKVTIDVESPATGTLLKILAQVGAIVPLAEVIAYIGEPGDEIPEKLTPLLKPIQVSESHIDKKILDSIQVPSTGPVKISPIARKLAEENNIDVTLVRGTGPQGRIVEADILSYKDTKSKSNLAQESTGEVPFKLHTLTPTRNATARLMSESFHSIPHFYLSMEINAKALVDFRLSLLSEYETRYGIHLTYTDLLLKALAIVLPEHPLLNAAYHGEGEIKIFDEINTGFAIATKAGLVVGVIHHVNQMGLEEISKASHLLTAKAKDHKLTFQDVTGGTFTLTNLGMYAVDNFSPIINPGQSAILALGAIKDRPQNENSKVVVQPAMQTTLAMDHRVIDGADGAVFLNHLRSVLETPEKLIV